MKPIVVSGVTPAQYQAFLAKVKAEAAVLLETTPTGGKLSNHGTVIGWTYADNTVTATVISKPFLETEGHIAEWLNEQLALPVAAKVTVAANIAAVPDWKKQLGLKG
jgi:hypothetical protein